MTAVDFDARLQDAEYVWPGPTPGPVWNRNGEGRTIDRDMPETAQELSKDSRWPAFFPAPLCLVTVASKGRTAVEREVGAAIVNRFPYVLALSFCRDALSGRHHPRRRFMELLEEGGGANVQFVAPGPSLDRVLRSVADIPDGKAEDRIPASGLAVRPGESSEAPVFREAFMVYEGRLAKPGRGFGGESVFARPWIDVGSHRVYFLEITCIQLRTDIAEGQSRILWRSLPVWEPQAGFQPSPPPAPPDPAFRPPYEKGYSPRYVFPAAATTGFEDDERKDGMSIKRLPPLPEGQLEVDNDRARWPCFFPSPLAMITTWGDGGLPNLMPCGSTTVVSRSPFTIAVCVSYARINIRYTARASLDFLRKNRAFGCGVPYIHDQIVAAVKYAGNVSFRNDPRKVARSGLAVEGGGPVPFLPTLPVQFECRVTGEIPLGTHVMILGEARRIRVREDVGAGNPLKWCPWPVVI